MKKKLTMMLAGAAALTWWIAAQPATPTRPLERIIPSGPLLVLQARDFAGLLRDWNDSPEKTAWLSSANYEVFSHSRLFLRLEQAQTEFATAAGVPAGMDLLTNVAGAESALALYNVGELQFLYVTRLPNARATQSLLWQKRAAYQQRTAAGQTYYLRSAGQRLAAFAVSNGLLLLATREDLIANALALSAGQGGDRAVGAEPWYVSAAGGLGSTQPVDLRLVSNFAAVVRTPYFRSYWIQRNASSLREFSATIADLYRSPTELREERLLLRAEPLTNPLPDEAAVGELVRWVPPQAGLYRASAGMTPAQVVQLWEEKLLNPRPRSSGPGRNAPGYAESGPAGTEADLETRIDQQPYVLEGGQLNLEALRRAAEGAGAQAILQIETARAQDVFVSTGAVVGVLGRQNWNQTAVQDALRTALADVDTTARLGLTWTNRQQGSAAYAALNGLRPLAIAARGRVLFLANDEALLQATLARSSAPAGQPAAYAAAYQHGRELPPYTRLMRMLDYPALAQASGEGREPLFFSENLAGLGRTLNRMQMAALSVHETAAGQRQTVRYTMKP